MDLREAAPPDFSDLDLDRYLAPDRILLYAPTRGCYWNRCSFCRYGLSETSTAPYREVPPERAASGIAILSRRHGTRNFYISCDVLSPSYAGRLAQALLDRGLRIRWASDLKIERAYTEERCRLLQRSGLRAAAFGVESGSDRILGLLEKGCSVADMAEANRRFHDAGVATQWMAFTGHPGEIPEEALETVRWIEREEERVDLFIVGEFNLVRGSPIARNPARFGVGKIYHVRGDDLRLHALFRRRDGGGREADRRRIDEEIGKLASRYALGHYPWAGAISTHHSFLRFLEFGQRAFRARCQAPGALRAPTEEEIPGSGIPGLRERPRFSLEEIRRQEKAFLEEYIPEALSLPDPWDGAGEEAPLCREHFQTACASVGSLLPAKWGRR